MDNALRSTAVAYLRTAASTLAHDPADDTDVRRLISVAVLLMASPPVSGPPSPFTPGEAILTATEEALDTVAQVFTDLASTEDEAPRPEGPPPFIGAYDPEDDLPF